MKLNTVQLAMATYSCLALMVVFFYMMTPSNHEYMLSKVSDIVFYPDYMGSGEEQERLIESPWVK